MRRLSDRSLRILRAEVQKCASGDLAGRVQRDIVLKRLEKMRLQPGPPASLDDLRSAIVDMFPNFSQKVLKAAARANRPPGPWGKIKFAAVVLIGATGGLYVLNLPYPMIRWPVARIAPILLLPSYISMDHHYRQAIAHVEQADQLINQPSSPADLTLGEKKLQAAEKNLDALPVWFLGYWPQHTFWRGWQFTLDEFKTARANVGRMEATLFQEKQAQVLLKQAEQALQTSKHQYQQAQTVADRSAEVATWQAALDILQQIPSETLAGRIAQTKLVAYTRDYEQVASFAAGSTRSGTLIEAAQEFAQAATQMEQKPPHAAAKWNQTASLWQKAIQRLEDIPVEDPGYASAQRLLATYQTNLGTAQTQLQAEQEAVEVLKQAQTSVQALVANSSSLESNQKISQIQDIMNQLQTIQPGTTAYSEAQSLMQAAQTKLEQL